MTTTESDVIKTLCQEYIELVDAMRSGSYSTDYLHTLDSDRQWHHNELCRLLRVDRTVDMYRYVQRIVTGKQIGRAHV